MEGTNCWPWLGLASSAITWSNWVAPNANYRLYTNCGPKAAPFTVSRIGSINDSLVVAYAMGGTAANSIAYIALPGFVNIPAGQRRAEITIVPLDDCLPDITSTGILKLIPDRTGTNYLLGLPQSAAAGRHGYDYWFRLQCQRSWSGWRMVPCRIFDRHDSLDAHLHESGCQRQH